MSTEIFKLDPQYPDSKVIAYCARVVRKGGLVIFPTETVYGIAADYSNPQAMKRLREVKKRSNDKPFSILISQIGLISNYTSTTDPQLYKLIDACWPGPLTVVVPSIGEEETIGVRIPDHPVALRLVQESQCTIAAPSANLEGKDPPSSCEEALKDLEGLVDVAIDGGTARIGKSSSVVDMTGQRPVILREGAITQQDIDRIIGKKTVLFICTGNSCRSVMAEYLLRDRLRGRDDVEVLSAGTSVFLQAMASTETIAVLRAQGIDACAHLSRPINTIMLKKADLIIVMTRGHREQVLERVPSIEKRVYLLKEFSDTALNGNSSWDVLDPIGQPRESYRKCLEEIKPAIEKIEKLI